VDHPATVLHAPSTQRSRSTAANPTPASALEHYIGQQVAGAAAALLLAWEERRDGGDVTSGIARNGGEFVAELVKLRNFLIGRADFDSMARRGGVIMLREACNQLSPSTCEELVAAVLEIVARVIRQELN
jgi:hypothetical protein